MPRARRSLEAVIVETNCITAFRINVASEMRVTTMTSDVEAIDTAPVSG